MLATMDRSSEVLEDDHLFADRYLQAFHWAISIFFGEHVLMPNCLTERIFTSVCLCLTFTLQIWFVSFITTAMTHLEIISTRRSSQFADLNRYMAEHNVPREVAMKVERNAQHAIREQEKNKPESSIELLALISEPLKVALHFEIHWPIVRSHPFFRCYAHVNLAGVRGICHEGIEFLSFTKDDIIFNDLEAPRKPQLLFVMSGLLQYKGQQETIEVSSNSHWITEAVLWTPDWVHCGTLQAATDSRLLALDAAVVQEYCGNFSSDHARKYAIGYVEHMNELSAEEHSDIGEYNTTVSMLLARVFPEEFSAIRMDYDPLPPKKTAHSPASTGGSGQFAAITPGEILPAQETTERLSNHSAASALESKPLESKSMESKLQQYLAPPQSAHRNTATRHSIRHQALTEARRSKHIPTGTPPRRGTMTPT